MKCSPTAAYSYGMFDLGEVGSHRWAERRRAIAPRLGGTVSVDDVSNDIDFFGIFVERIGTQM